MKPSRTFVIGVGNEFRGDDAAGLIAARKLRSLVPSDVRVIEHTGEGAALLDLWQGAKTVILLDAVQSGASPGTIHRIHANTESLPLQYFQHSTHAFDVGHAVELARALQCLPLSLWVFGIEGDSFRYSIGLSPPIQQAVANLTSELANQYRQPWRPRLQTTAHGY